MRKSLYLTMVALSAFVASAARADLVGIIVDGRDISYTRVTGTKFINIDSSLGYHLSGSFEFDFDKLYYALLLNNGPTVEAHITLYFTGPSSWYNNIVNWRNNASVRFTGNQAGSIMGETVVSQTIGTGVRVGSDWKFVNEIGSQDSHDQTVFFPHAPQTTFSVNLIVAKSLGLSVDMRGYAGIAPVPEPSVYAMAAMALSAAWMRRRAKR